MTVIKWEDQQRGLYSGGLDDVVHEVSGESVGQRDSEFYVVEMVSEYPRIYRGSDGQLYRPSSDRGKYVQARTKRKSKAWRPVI